MSHRPVPSLSRQRPRLTDSQRSEAVERYEAGESANSIAAEFGVHRTTVVRLLQDRGVAVRHRIISEEDVALAQTLYDQGWSLARVGDEFGVAAWTVLAAFRRVGIPTRRRGTNQWAARG